MPIRDMRTISTWLKIALICLLLAVILFVTGFATNAWIVHGIYRSSEKIGLWEQEVCDSYRCTSRPFTSYAAGFHKASQAMECLGLIGLLMGTLILILYVCVDSCRRREALLATIFFLFGAVLFMVIGFAVFGSNYSRTYTSIGWSMGIAIAGCVLTFIAGVMCVLQIMGK